MIITEEISEALSNLELSEEKIEGAAGSSVKQYKCGLCPAGTGHG